jgi:hypothetical protein
VVILDTAWMITISNEQEPQRRQVPLEVLGGAGGVERNVNNRDKLDFNFLESRARDKKRRVLSESRASVTDIRSGAFAPIPDSDSY